MNFLTIPKGSLRLKTQKTMKTQRVKIGALEFNLFYEVERNTVIPTGLMLGENDLTTAVDQTEYKKAIAQLQQQLGEPEKLTDHLKGIDALLKFKKITIDQLVPYPNPENGLQKFLNAVAIIAALSEILNEGKEPDWENENEIKYVLWVRFKKNPTHPSGFGFSLTSYAYWATGTNVGSRLCFKNSDDVMFVHEFFKETVADYFLF